MGQGMVLCVMHKPCASALLAHTLCMCTLQEIPEEVEVDIGKDIKRTFPLYRKFCTEEGQQQLSGVLRAYAAHDPEVSVQPRSDAPATCMACL